MPAAQPSRRRPVAPVVLLAGALFATMVLLAGDLAAGDQSETELEPIGSLVPDDQLDPRILPLDLTSGEYRRSVDALESSLFSREQTRRELDGSTVEVGRLLREGLALRRQIGESRQTLEQATTELARTETELADRAVERFVRHGADVAIRLDPEASIAAARGARLSAEADDAQLERRAQLRVAIGQLEMTIGSLETELTFTDLARTTLNDQIADLEDALARLDEDVEDASSRLASARRSARVTGAGIPVIALDAYLDAEVSIAEADPACGLRWWMVAGVARVESRHGEIGGRRLRADGRVNEPIIGVALDGGPSVQLVVDTDAGRLDDDSEFDRAVGPLQFIPETWGRLGRDGNGDGVEDPQNIYDASLAAASYLCRLGSSLGNDASLRDALYGYNSSWEYVELVLHHGLRFSELDLPETT